MDDFLDAWKKELKQQQPDSQHKESVSILNKRCHNKIIEGEQSDVIPLPEKQQCLEESGAQNTPSALFVLPIGNSSVNKGPKKDNIASSSEEVSATQGQLVEQLISDLNEVTSIPFFDIQLPKEIAIMIFRYLGIKDLCNCSLVSKGWSVIAQDNSVWMMKCHYMGYDTVSSIEIVQSWKNIVKELVMRERRIQQNWKERVCSLSDFQPRHTGTLCCTAYDDGQILSCYSCGSTYVWSVEREADQAAIRLISPLTSALPNLLPTTCSIKNNLAAVGDNSGLLCIIDITTFKTVHTVHNRSPIRSIDIINDHDNCYTVAVSTDGLLSSSTIKVLSCRDVNSHQWSSARLALPSIINVNRLSLIDINNQDTSRVLYSTNTSLTLQENVKHCLGGAHMSIYLGNLWKCTNESYDNALHLVTPPDVNGSLLTYVNSYCYGDGHVACGVFDFDCNRVHLYDLANGNLKQRLDGHKGRINCLGFEKKDYKRIASGSNDKRYISNQDLRTAWDNLIRTFVLGVLVYDPRGNTPVISLIGHTSNVLCVQIEDWKVISGSEDGQIILWDLRKGCDLWHSRERHPVSSCCFDDNYLVTSHIPKDRSIISSNNTSSLYTKQRGLIRVYDFSYDPLYNRLPLICSSKYDEPSASFHHLDLRLPYDKLDN